MKTLIRSPRASWAIRVVLILLGLAIIAALAFAQGMFYANRRATIRMANDGCLYSLNALTALKDPEKHRLAVLFDWEMDSSALKLAEMSLDYPGLIQRTHYNLLVRIREYRGKYGRGPETSVNINPVEVDRSVAKAIAYLESIHNTNDWLPYRIEVDTQGNLKVKWPR